MATIYTPEQLQSIAYQQLHPDDNAGYQIIVAAAICAPIAVAAVAGRIWARYHAKVRLGIDDYLMIVALILYIIYAISSTLTVKYGMGQHLIYVNNANALGAMTLLAECAYNVVVPTTKISVLFFYRRIFPQKWFRITLLWVGALIVAYSLAQFLADVLQCTPIQKIWTPSIPGTCIDFWGVVLFGTIFNVITDVITLILPIPVLWGLKTEKSRRFQLVFAFSIGGVACISSIVRAFYTKNVSQFDSTWYYVPTIISTTVECGMFIVSACIPTYATLFKQRRDTNSRARKSKNSPSGIGTNNSVNVAMSSLGPRREKWSTLDTNSSQEEDKKVMITTDIETRYDSHPDRW